MNKDAGKSTPRKNKDIDEKHIGTPAGEEGKQRAKGQPPSLPQILPFLPLLHTEIQEACMMLCLQLLGLKTKRGAIDQAQLERVCPPPIISNGEFSSLDRQNRSFYLSFTHTSFLIFETFKSSLVTSGATPSFSSSFIPVPAKGGG